jgi:light-regulated signal transduction histidine kinase (bacteriophytochrome)
MGDADQSRTENEILELRRQLDRANAEFERFISMAAHDLRESLREVAAFSQLLAETDGSPLLRNIQDSADRMQSLLTDVVDYWAADADDRHFSGTDMEAALGQALLSMEKQIAERTAIVTHDPLPRVRGNFEILTKVLRHLVRNAIEYCGTPSPRVHVSARRKDLECVFSVQDNGPGIDPAFKDRIFGVFKRLHGKEHPGSGLGLAFCKKAIERHGGRIWMESTPGEGATFHFTLPPAD